MFNARIGQTACAASAAITTKLLEAEVGELQAAVEARVPHEILDEAADVIYRVKELAKVFGISSAMLEEYASYKGRLRANLGKDKSLEHRIARGIINEAAESRKE